MKWCCTSLTDGHARSAKQPLLYIFDHRSQDVTLKGMGMGVHQRCKTEDAKAQISKKHFTSLMYKVQQVQQGHRNKHNLLFHVQQRLCINTVDAWSLGAQKHNL